MFTRREKHVLVFLAIIFPILYFADLPAIIKSEFFWLIFVVIPVGIYLVTDRERRDITPKE